MPDPDVLAALLAYWYILREKVGERGEGIGRSILGSMNLFLIKES